MFDYDEDEQEYAPWKDVRASIKKAVIKEGVTSIGDYAFSYCVSLKAVEIPNSVTSIGISSFSRCFDLESIDIPSSVTSIGTAAFYNCKGLTSVTIPSSVTAIADNLFNKCSNLVSVDLPPTLTAIGFTSFGECTSLSNITIPPSVESFDMFAFQRCDSLTSINIPSAVTEIPLGAFYGCINLTNVILPPDLEYIASFAFRECFSLENITIPTNVEIVDDFAFYDCRNLSSIEIEEGVQAIGTYAFYRANITNVTIPSSIIYLGGGVFKGCLNLVSIKVDDANQVYMSDDEGVLFEIEDMKLVQYPCGKEGDYVVPDGVTSIVASSFEEAQKVTSVTIPASVEEIGFGSFLACTSLESFAVDADNEYYKEFGGVLFDKDGTTLLQYPCAKDESYVMADTVSTIGPYAFSGCTDLKEVNISSSVTTVGESAFYQCSGLTSVTIPASVETIVYAFVGCPNLASITVDNNNPTFSSIDGVLFNKNGTKLLQYPCGHGSTYTVPNSVTCIGEYSFFECLGLSSATIPASVTKIEAIAFNTVNMAYVNYLGSTEPEFPDPSSAFVSVDVVCVPKNYTSESFCRRYSVKVDSCEEFVAQHNQCYEVLEWQAQEITVKKRANATLWDKKTNNCFEYQCFNATGGKAWSKCNSTNDEHWMCADNSCVREEEAIKKDKYAVEMSYNIAPSEYDVEELTLVLVNITGLQDDELSIASEATESTGNVIRVVVFVDDEESANDIVAAVEDNKGKGEDCSVGILCQASNARLIIPDHNLSDANIIHNNHNNLIVFIITSILLMVFSIKMW